MAINKTPVRVDGGVRPKSGFAASDLVEIARQNGEFSKNFGKFWGGLLLMSAVNAASGRRPFLWGGMIVSLLVGSLEFLHKYGWHLPWAG